MVGKSCPIGGRTHHAVFERLLSHHLAADMIMLLFDIILIINNSRIGCARSTSLREEALESDNIIIICYLPTVITYENSSVEVMEHLPCTKKNF